MFQRDDQVSVLSLAVPNWRSHASLQIKQGRVVQRSNASAAHGRPEVLFTSWRGVYRAIWDEVNSRFAFEPLSDNFVSFDDKPTAVSTWIS